MNFLNRLVPASIRANEDLLMRSYVMLGIILLNSSVSFLGVITFLFIVKLPSDIAWIALLFVAVGFAGYLLILGAFLWTKSYAIASNSVIVMLLLMIYSAIQITGGFASSVMTQICFLLPAMAFLLTELRGGVFWLLATCTLSAVSLTLSRMGYGYVSLMPDDYENLFRNVLHFVLFFMVGGAILMYEIINQYLKDKVSAEKDRYRGIVGVATDSSVVTESADALAWSAASMFESSLQQKSAIEELVATTGQLNETAQHNNLLAKSAQDSIKAAEQHIELSKTDIHKLLDSMNHVKSSSAEIQKINSVINDIAQQTNLLSLNAMIEAARSSGGGEGFRVVAGEVGRLAEKSAAAVHEINRLLDSNMLSVQDVMVMTELMHRRFEEIAAKIKPLIDSIQDISNASYEQSEAIREITLALMDIDRAVNENRSAAEETSHLAGELRGNAQQLSALVSGL